RWVRSSPPEWRTHHSWQNDDGPWVLRPTPAEEGDLNFACGKRTALLEVAPRRKRSARICFQSAFRGYLFGKNDARRGRTGGAISSLSANASGRKPRRARKGASSLHGRARLHTRLRKVRSPDCAHRAWTLHSFESARDRGHRRRAIERSPLSELKSFPRQRFDET